MCAYDGSRFFGSAKQLDKHTVINAIEKIFSHSLGINASLLGSGRTDKGVHSTNQVLHTDIPDFWDNRLPIIQKSLNKHLIEKGIYIKSVSKVDESFNARFSAKSRVYRYILSTSKPSVFLYPYVAFVDSVDETKIKEAIKLFEGTHDFEYFKKTDKEEDSSIRIIYKTRFYKYKGFYVFYIEGNGFLRSQIRMIVYFLLQISANKLTIQNLQEQLSKQKRYTTDLAVPNGLYLAKIKY